MKKILILNGGHSEIPLIKAAKELGYYVITSGNKPELIGHKYADEYVYGDFSDCGTMLKIAIDKNVQAVCSCANDFGAISASYVAEKLGLGGHDKYDTSLILHKKDRFKNIAKEICFKTPASDIYDSLEKAIINKHSYKYPIIVKPVDLTGGKGVSKINNETEYENAVSIALKKSRERKIVVEEFIEGTYHSFSTFLVERKVVAWFCDNEYSNVYKYFVDTSAGPADDYESIKDILIEQSELIAEKLNLANGVFHMQYVKDRHGMPHVIDITRRCSGDIYTEPVEHSTGIPWAKWIVMSEAGYDSSSFVERGEQRKYCGRHCIMAMSDGVVQDVIISDEIKSNIYKDLIWWKEGDVITDHFIDKLGILFLEYSSREEMLDKTSRIKDLVKVILK